jgi:homoserine O-succinyltransferase
MAQPQYRPETIALHGGQTPDPTTGSRAVPIYQTTSYQFKDVQLAPLHGDFDDAFFCAHSRHSGIDDRALEEAHARGQVALLAHGSETGYTIFESADRRFLMHLGHPEYEASRLVHEWQRDQSLGRIDVQRPQNFDPDNPANVWRSHRNELFSKWLRFLDARSVDDGSRIVDIGLGPG